MILIPDLPPPPPPGGNDVRLYACPHCGHLVAPDHSPPARVFLKGDDWYNCDECGFIFRGFEVDAAAK